MDFLQKNNFRFYFRSDAVTVEIPHSTGIGSQYISFNCYQLQSRKRFTTFKNRLQTSEINEFDNINDIYGLAREYDVRATMGHKPTFVDTIAF